MRLESAMHTSSSGISTHGKAISVIGDNIANVNTVGYRGSRSEFSDILATADSNRQFSSIYAGGSGVELQGVRSIFIDGINEATNRSLDAAIDGSGFFLVGDANQPMLTRAGNFQVNEAGILVTAGGLPVLGTTGVEGAALGEINMLGVELGGRASTEVNITGNLSSFEAAGEMPDNIDSFRDLGERASFSTAIDVVDSLGAQHNVSLYFFREEGNNWNVQAYVDGEAAGGEAGTPQLVGQVQLQFNQEGTIAEEQLENSILNIQVTFNDAAQSDIAVNLSRMTQYAAASQLDSITGDGQGAGSIIDYEFGKDGTIYATLDTGRQVEIGRLQLGRVTSVDGLDRMGNSLFAVTNRAGDLRTGAPSTEGFGGIDGSALERSPIDLSREFVDLVLVQRGYQANSQVLTQTNQIIRETINMLR